MKSLKLTLLIAVIGLFSSQGFAQAKKTKSGMSAGLLGAVNLTEFRVTNARGIDYKMGTGWAAGHKKKQNRQR